MNISYADVVRARGDGRNSPPILNAEMAPPIAPPTATTPSSRDQSRVTPATAMELETAPTTTTFTPPFQRPAQGINPTKPSQGESLPDGFARNYVGFLIKTNKKRIHVSKDLVTAEERYLQDHLVVASFIGGCPNSASLNSWLSKINSAISGGSVFLMRRPRQRLHLPQSLESASGEPNPSPHTLQI